MMNLAIATRNAHKAGEIKTLLGARFAYWTLDALPGSPRTVEDASTFDGNAQKKAVELARWLAAEPPLVGNGQPWLVLADDSGLEVDALGGAPGVRSARYAAAEGAGEANSTDVDNNARLLRELASIPAETRTARFRCVIALAAASPVTTLEAPFDRLFPQPPESVVLFGGVCEGTIGFEPRGKGGFGYDPLFVPEGCQESFAELGEAAKNRISHRAQALEQIRQRLLASAGCIGLK